MGAALRTTSAGRLARLIPILDWSRRYDRRWLRGDVIAGIAVAAMIVPKDLGYAGIAGIPLENGLYAAAAAAIIYGLFCTSRHISTGPSSSLAAVAGGAVLVTGLSGGEAAQLVAAIAVATGALFLLVAILKLGWLASFLSRAVVTGFLAGAAIDVGARRSQPGDAAGRAPCPRRDPWASARVAQDPGGARARGGRPDLFGRAGPRHPRRGPGGTGASRSAAAAGAVDRARCAEPPGGRHRGVRAAAHRVLADCRGCAGVRDQAPLSNRPQPGVGRAGDGQPRRGDASGDAGLDEPFGQLAQRVRRSA